MALKEPPPVKNDGSPKIMKKSIAYATIAVLLGVALMFAPFLALPIYIERETYAEQLTQGKLAPENFRTLSAESESFAGVTPNYPTDALSFGLILTFSLAFALIVSLKLREKRLNLSRSL